MDMRIRSKVLIVLLFLMVSSNVKFSLGKPTDNNSSFQKPIGTTAANFYLTDILSNQTFSLADFQGKTIILDLFTTWCPPCRESVPRMRDIYNSYSAEELTIISVDIDVNETESLVRTFILEYEMEWFVALDNDSIVRSYYGSGYIPTMYIIDQNQTIVYSEVGFYFTNIINTLDELSLEPISSLPTYDSYDPSDFFSQINDFFGSMLFIIVCVLVIVIIFAVIYIRRQSRNRVEFIGHQIKEPFSPYQGKTSIRNCPTCGQKLLSEAKFCSSCGSNIKEF